MTHESKSWITVKNEHQEHAVYRYVRWAIYSRACTVITDYYKINKNNNILRLMMIQQ